MFFKSTRALNGRDDRGPLRTLFMLTSMPVGGAETLLVNLIERMDRERFWPEVCCLKERGPLGEYLAESIPVHSDFTQGKLDLRVLGRLTKLIRQRRFDAVVTVGCGDKMFWGRLAAYRAGCPVIASALHSTGWPDGVGRLNRLLTPITDAFIGCAQAHGEHLVNGERFPKEKVHVIPNGVDVDRFRPSAHPDDGGDISNEELRANLGLPTTGPIATIVAALRPEKNHRRFLQTAEQVLKAVPESQFVIVGEGDIRSDLEAYASELKIESSVHFLGNRSDIPEILRASDAFLLTSDNEAAPVSIMEAMASGIPVVASDVGSVHEMVIDGPTGFLVPKDPSAFADRLTQLFTDSERLHEMGTSARDHAVNHASVEVMVRGYQDLINTIYDSKVSTGAPNSSAGQEVTTSCG